MPLIQYGQVDSGIVSYDRITENSDTRITEAGDTRITNDVVTNVVTSTLIAVPTLNTTFKEMFYNVSGAWKTCIPYVKHNNTWKLPVIYVKQSGIWIRTL